MFISCKAGYHNPSDPRPPTGNYLNHKFPLNGVVPSTDRDPVRSSKGKIGCDCAELDWQEWGLHLSLSRDCEDIHLKMSLLKS